VKNNGENNLLNANESKQKFEQSIDEYLESSHIVFSKYKEEYAFYSDMELSDLANKSRSELLDIAYMLQGYASYIQDETNRNLVVLNWCNSVLDELLVKFEKTAAFDKYTKFDMKKVIMISDNSFAQTIEELRKTASTRVTLLEGKVFQVKKMSDIILEKSRL
jgi:uncharacterized protein YlzI (FlbEa/FlbD family)